MTSSEAPVDETGPAYVIDGGSLGLTSAGAGSIGVGVHNV